jgi:hypothetical protein
MEQQIPGDVPESAAALAKHVKALFKDHKMHYANLGTQRRLILMNPGNSKMVAVTDTAEATLGPTGILEAFVRGEGFTKMKNATAEQVVLITGDGDVVVQDA